LFDNRTLAGISVSRRGREAGKWRKLHSGGLIKFYSPPNWATIIMTESMTFRLAGHLEKYVRSIIDDMNETDS
jgi:hypothetical protein